MTMLRNVELTETLRAIMSRNTEYYQTDYAEALSVHELPDGDAAGSGGERVLSREQLPEGVAGVRGGAP